jgi:hypothetical protein
MKFITAAVLAQTCLQAGMSDSETARMLHDNGFRPPEPVVERERALSRRSFITQMSSAVAAAAILPDPERLLWTPEEKKIIIDAPTREIVRVDDEWLLKQHESKLIESDLLSAQDVRDIQRQHQRIAGRQRLDVSVGGEYGSVTYEGGRVVSATKHGLRLANTPFDGRRRK